MRAILLSVILICSSTALRAQTLAQEWMSAGAFSVDVLRPHFDEGDVEFPSVSGFFNLRLPLGNVALLADVPFAMFSRTTLIAGTETSRAIGNVMIGVEASRGAVALNGTVRLPTAPEGEAALVVGSWSDIQRDEAFMPKQLSLRGGINYRSARTRLVNLDVGAGLLVLVANDESAVVDTEVLIDYGFMLVHRPRALGVTGGVLGRALISQSGPSFDERSVHELRFTVDYTTTRLRPYLGATIPLDEGLNDLVQWILRVGLQVALR